MGAVMIEKHFTLDRNLCGPDHSYALEPQELKAMVENIRTVEKLLGSPIKQPSKAELKTRVLANRSIFASRDIPVGTSITEEMLVVLRPAIGLQPKYLEMVVGRKARKSITQNEPITWENV
jgi:N-acetylneuraminate synthase/N,N'-diacetyllegionaminate synthase